MAEYILYAHALIKGAKFRPETNDLYNVPEHWPPVTEQVAFLVNQSGQICYLQVREIA
jgi:hypothetical protein